MSLELGNGAGLFHTPLAEALKLTPALEPIIAEAPLVRGESYVVDSK